MKLKYYSIALLSALAIASCDDELTTYSDSTYTDNVVFSNSQLTEDAVMAIYSWFGATNSHRGRYVPFYGMNTDSEYYTDLENISKAQTQLMNYACSPDNSQMVAGKDPNAYTCFYNAVEASNLCISGIRKFGDLEDNEMKYLLGESLVLRAQFYYDIVRAWGDVPVRFEPVDGSTIMIPKSDRDVVYKQLIADLKEAADYLPWPNETKRTQTVERANKAYALGLRARLILMAYGYAQRPLTLDDPNSSTLRRSNDADLTSPSLIQEALDDLKKIISNSGCSLNSTYSSIWTELCTDVITSGRESIFEVPYAAGRGRFFYHFSVYHYDSSDNLTKSNYGGQNACPPTLYYEYMDGDSRRDVNCVPYKWDKTDFGGYTLANLFLKNGSQYARPGFNFGKYDYEHMKRQVTSNDDGINLPVIRFADILLMAAECANELGDINAAKGYLKQVRERAFHGSTPAQQTAGVTDYLAAITTKDQMLSAIQQERLLEFPGEMLRKQDLIRWNLLGTNVKATVSNMTALKNRTGKYANIPHTVWTRTIDGKFEYYGLNAGETTAPAGEGWTELDYDFITESCNDNLLTHYYVNDPDTKQYWPIFTSDITTNTALINNYGY